MKRPGSEERLARLLAMIPWIVAHDGPSVSEVCERFGLSPSELAADIGLLWMCGLHPYTPDMLIEAEIRDQRVWVSYADYFSRPLRLTPVEGLSLLTAAQTLLAFPGNDPQGPLATGLAKLAASLGTDDASVRVDLGSAADAVVEVLLGAVSDGVQADIDYLSFSRNERSRRRIDPDHVYVAQGQWYVSGWCHLANAARTFRIDRIAVAERTAEPRNTTPTAHPPALFTEAPTGGIATLVVSPDDSWVTEQYPTVTTESQPDGSTRITLAISDLAWLDRLALRLGDGSQVVSAPPGWGGASSAAQRVLARYERAQ